MRRFIAEDPANAVAKSGPFRTPLELAVNACVDSYWTEYRSTDSAQALPDAGASVRGVPYPCGYDEMDALLKSHGAGR